MKNATVVLIEAGGEPPMDFIVMPATKKTIYTNICFPPACPECDWQFKIVPPSNITCQKITLLAARKTSWWFIEAMKMTTNVGLISAMPDGVSTIIYHISRNPKIILM